MGIKKPLQLIVLILLLLPAVYSLEEVAPFIYNIKQIISQIPAGGESEFTIEIKSNLKDQQVLQLSPDDLGIFPFSEFARAVVIDPMLINIKNKEVQLVNVKIRSLDTAAENRNHITIINVKSLTSDYKDYIQLNTFIMAEKDLVQIIPKLPEVVIPGELNQVRVYFKNRGNVEFEDLELYLSSEIWNENAVLSFKANENKTEFFSMDIPAGTKAGEYLLSARLYKGKELKGEAKTTFQVSHHPDIKEKEETSEGFLTSEIKITNRNDGNAPVKRTLDLEMGFFKRILTETTPKAEVKNGKYFWEFTVEPATEFIVTAKTDYRPGLIGLIVLAAFIGLLVYFLSRGVRIKKRVFKIKHAHYADSEVKVMIHVKNRDNREVHNIKLIELIPNAIRLTHEYGTLKPEKVQQGTRGMRLIWTLETLSPGEERILSYNARIEKNILGSIYLPSASVQYINRKAKKCFPFGS